MDNSLTILFFALFVLAVLAKLLTRGNEKHIQRPGVEDDLDDDKTIRPYEIHVDESVLEDLRQRLESARYPDEIETTLERGKGSRSTSTPGWEYGTNLPYLKQLVDYWVHSYDWREAEKHINETFDEQFTTTINGKRMHFAHIKSPRSDAKPLLLLHGWPGSFFEFHKVVRPLSRPEDDSSPAFHLIIPSLPGYGFSEAPRNPGYDVQAVAADMARLMRRLGYAKYLVQGGDWGALVASYIAILDAKRCKAIHINFLVAFPPKGIFQKIVLVLQFTLLKRWSFTKEELRNLEDAKVLMREESGYSAIQSTKPQTLGYGLNDSPVGLLAWILEKFQHWSDCKDGDVETSFTKDELLTDVMIYWVTGTITSSVRLYYETRKARRFGGLDGRVDVPTGCALYPKEAYKPPRRWVSFLYNVVHWAKMPRGGHFAALEVPDVYVKDVRSYFKRFGSAL